MPLSILKNLHLCFQSILFINAFLCRASRCYWRTSKETGRYSSIARTISHSKCARYEFAILNLTRTKSGLFRFLDIIPRVGYLQFKPIPTIKSVHHVIVNQTSTNYHAWIVLFLWKILVTYLRRLPKYEKYWKLLTNISGDLTIYITSETVAAEPDDKDDSIAELMSKVQVQEHDYYLLKVQETVHSLKFKTTES